MEILYTIAGLVALSLIGRWLRRKTAVAVPPPHIQLYPATASGQHAKDLLERRHDLDACGMKRIGTYRVDPLNVVCTAFLNEAESICTVVYHHSAVGCFVDVVSKSEAGRTFTASNAPQGGTLDQREGHVKVFDRTLGIPEMFEMVKERRPEGPWDAWNRDNFAQRFEQAYADEMAWRATRGGVTRDEVRRTAQASGKTYPEEHIQQATRQIQDQYAQSRRDHA